MKLLFLFGIISMLVSFFVIRYEVYTSSLKKMYTNELSYGDVAACSLFLVGLLLLVVSAIWWAVV